MTLHVRAPLLITLAAPALVTFGCFKAEPNADDDATGTSDTTGTTDMGTDTAVECPEGTESCPCLPGGLCDEGLSCVGSGICAPTPSDTDTGGSVCGDGTIDEGEECDNGPDNGDDQACTASCKHAICGDGLVLADIEECDSGVESADCDEDCTFPTCGDGIVNELAGETCDDGNLDPTDQCTDQCLLATCGDGILNIGEECDDGNLDPDDDCTADCKSLWWAEGPQVDIPQDNLVGWELCWSSLYGSSMEPVSNILSACNKGKLLMACRPVADSDLTLLAMGPRPAVTFDTGTGNVPYNNNGVGWYFNNSHSWGFALEGDTIQRSSCDVATGNDQFRMCWHTYNMATSGGFRCGETKWLNS
ncbi:MAG: DUF4215 domain-containing protein, partial [Myxococcales bacterium]|nr:DUF4215 domain-containing protein [Myxococcales bacterium]